MLSSIQCQDHGGMLVSIEKSNKNLVRRQVREAWNEGNLAVLHELMAPNLIYHGLPPGMAPGLQGFKQLISMNHDAFPDIRVTIEDIIAEGDKVAVRWTWSGTHKGAYMGIQPTGKHVTVNGMSIHRIEDGMIVENWHEMNMLDLMQQLGVAQPAGKEQ
jgi:steroid delta-isomerase-like uncharacterized protein